MKRSEVKKLNKVATATVLAISGIAAVAPQPAAAKTFEDLNPLADYYKPVIELLERGIINGYSDGTFRPNQAVTRGQAAKMLALALKLDIKNVKNPNFKDVPFDHQYYPYIAALAGEGIINGYSDYTYQPNEPITRGQMAKILTLGYGFGVAEKLAHEFKDVSSKNSNAYYIQTLTNLKITKGKSPVAFHPSNPVTRAQLATFIVRAENADGSYSSVNKVGKIDGNKIYVNSIPYTIDASLRTILNESNEAVLQGAYIEGNFAGTTLKSITKLTLNASGTENQKLIFNGNASSFSGQLILNGSYLQFKNWTLAGTVTISETRIKTLSEKRLQKIRIASLRGIGFIDWTNPTQTTEDEDYLNPQENEYLKDVDNAEDLTNVIPHMPITDKYIDFTNCIVSRLIIEQNRTYVAGNNKIGTVTIQGEVSQFELKADVGTMYFENEADVTMYGLTDIDTAYKNSYYSVFFNTNSFISLLIVDNGYGWIDLGETTWIDEVKLPKGVAISEVFDDFENDEDRNRLNPDKIKDEDGNSPPKMTDDFVSDRTPPEITAIEMATTESAYITGTIEASEEGTYYLIAIERGDGVPTVSEILAVTSLPGSRVAKGELKMENGQVKAAAAFRVGGLEPETDYILYGVVKDKAGNFSKKWLGTSFKTIDGAAPEISGFKASGLPGGVRAKLTFTPSEPGTYYYIYQNADAPPPSRKDVLNSKNKGVITSDEVNKEKAVILNGLEPETNYKVYLAMEDLSKNPTKEVYSSKEFATTELDMDSPFIINHSPKVLTKEPTIVFLEFNEELDKESAEDITNYELGGTGNLTGNPYKAELQKDGRTVKLEVPSAAAFVHNDTLTVKASNIQDLAGNEILSSLPNSTVTFTYDKEATTNDNMLSNIDVDEVGPVKGGIIKLSTTFESTKTGTYYYIVVPNSPTGNRPEPKVSDVMFPEDYIDDGGEVFKSGSFTAVKGENRIPDIPVDLESNEYKQNKYGFRIYIVMEDRNKVRSKVVSDVFISDTIPPTIVNQYSGWYSDGVMDKTKKDTFKYTEGKQFEFYFEFSEPMDKTSVEKSSNYKIIAKDPSSNTLTSLNLKPSVVYTEKKDELTGEVRYLAVMSIPADRDLVENTVFEISLLNVMDKSQEKTNIVQDKKEFIYKDFVSPRVENELLYRVIDTGIDAEIDSDVILEMTFSEAVDPESLKGAQFTVVTNGSQGQVEYIDGSLSTDGTKIHLKLKDPKDNQEYKVVVKDVKDRASSGNTIDFNKDNSATYLYRKFDISFQEPEIVESEWIQQMNGLYRQKPTKIRIPFDNIGQHYSNIGAKDIEYYYIVVPNRTVVDSVNYIINPPSDVDGGNGDIILKEGGQRDKIEIYHSVGFYEGDIIYFVIKDKYFNRVQVFEYEIKNLQEVPTKPSE